MSYDIRLEVDTGGRRAASVTEWWSPTFNLSSMFRKALAVSGITGGMHGKDGPCLDGMRAELAVPVLQAALHDMRERRAEYEKLNPANGWGDYDGAVETFRILLEACMDHPKATVRT